MSKPLPAKFQFLLQDPKAPLMVQEAIKLYGTLETPGAANNPTILGWADEIARVTDSKYDDWVADFYNADSIAWCGLFIAICALRSSQGRPERYPVDKYLSALAWANWGTPVKVEDALIGDVGTKKRSGGGHVFIIIGMTPTSLWGIGGNQNDAVTIAEFPKSVVHSVSRPKYIVKPDGARKVMVTSAGAVPVKEA